MPTTLDLTPEQVAQMVEHLDAGASIHDLYVVGGQVVRRNRTEGGE